MEENADLKEKIQQLEHENMQLQCETDTISKFNNNNLKSFCFNVKFLIK